MESDRGGKLFRPPERIVRRAAGANLNFLPMFKPDCTLRDRDDVIVKTLGLRDWLVERTGIEPATLGLQSRCSPN
jgi:hypothetical protein